METQELLRDLLSVQSLIKQAIYILIGVVLAGIVICGFIAYNQQRMINQSALAASAAKNAFLQALKVVTRVESVKKAIVESDHTISVKANDAKCAAKEAALVGQETLALTKEIKGKLDSSHGEQSAVL